VQGALGEAFAAGDPLLDPRSRSGSRFETRAYDVAVREDQIRQDIVAAAVGDHDLDALARRARRNAALGRHASATARGTRRVDVLREVAARGDAADDLRGGVRRRTVVDAVDIAQDDERLGSHHRRHETRKFVVVGEHQLRDRDRVVLVDDRDDARREHRLHAVALVEVLPPRGEALLGGEHLPAGDAVFVEEVVVAVQQFHLPDGREELAGRNGVDASDAGFEQAAARGHGARRDEDELRAGPVQARQLVHERRDARGVGPSVLAGEHIAADLDDDAAVFFRFTIHNSQFKIASSGQTDSVACPPPLPSLRGAWRRGNPIKGRNLTTRSADSHVGPSALPGMTIQFSPFVSGFIFISHALDRDDAFVADLLAQLADVHVDRAVAHDDLRAPDLGVNLLAGNQLPGRRVEQVQQRELLAREGDFLSVADHRVTLAVDREPRGRGLLGRSVGVDALEDRLHAAYQQLHLDRLGQVVVGSHVEPCQLLPLLAQRREENHHRVLQHGVSADRAAGLRPVHHRHHHVQQDQVRTAFGGHFQRLGAVFGREDFVTLAYEVVTDEFEDVYLVVDQQDTVTHGVGFRSGGPRGAVCA
jgi:hypothetical protein